MLRFGLDDDSVRISDCVWRAGRLTHACRSHGEDKQFAGSVANRIQMIGVVPEKLVDLQVRQKSCKWRDRIRAVEMEDL